jgi:NCAIR mutase (PurE)-related protein
MVDGTRDKKGRCQRQRRGKTLKFGLDNEKHPMTQALIGVVMGSSSDWDTMQHAVQILQQFGIPHDARVVSAHRMPDDMFDYAQTAASRGLQAIIAGAGGAAHQPGLIAAKTVVPVLGVPVQTNAQGCARGHLCHWRSGRGQRRSVCRRHAG